MLTGGPFDTGAFHGFLESSPIIKSFTLTNNIIGIVDVTTSMKSSAVPEPGSLALLGSGLLLLGGVLRRKVGR